MARIENRSTGPLEIGGKIILPGTSAEVSGWHKLSTDAFISIWLDRGIIAVLPTPKKKGETWKDRLEGAGGGKVQSGES